MPNTIYAKDDGAVTIYEDRVEWEWYNGSGGSDTDVFSLEEAANELDAAGREDLAALVRETLFA